MKNTLHQESYCLLSILGSAQKPSVQSEMFSDLCFRFFVLKIELQNSKLVKAKHHLSVSKLSVISKENVCHDKFN